MITELRILPYKLSPTQQPSSPSPNILPFPLNARSPPHSPHMRSIRLVDLSPRRPGNVRRLADLPPGRHGVGLGLVGPGAGLAGGFVGLVGVLVGFSGVFAGALDFVA